MSLGSKIPCIRQITRVALSPLRLTVKSHQHPKFYHQTWDTILGACVLIPLQMGVSENRGYPQIIHFNRVFHYKPSILGYPYFWKHPNLPTNCVSLSPVGVCFWKPNFFGGVAELEKLKDENVTKIPISKRPRHTGCTRRIHGTPVFT